jgi:hypothetical protein
MAKKPDEQPDMKEIAKRNKDAKALCKKLEQCKKEASGIAAQVKLLEQKAG